MSDFSEVVEAHVHKNTVEQAVSQTEQVTLAPLADLGTSVEEKKDLFTMGLLSVTSVMDEFAAHKDKVIAFIDKKDEKTQHDYRPVVADLFMLKSELGDQKGFPTLEESSQIDGTIQKKVMDAYFKSFDPADFEFVKKSYENWPEDDMFVGKVVKLSYVYTRFLYHRKRLGDIFKELSGYRDEPLDEETLHRMDLCAEQLEKDLSANPVNKDVSIEDYIEILNTRIEHFEDFYKDCDKVYSFGKDTKAERRIKSEQLRRQSHKKDDRLMDLYGVYIRDLNKTIVENVDEAHIPDSFKDFNHTDIYTQNLVGYCQNVTDLYASAYRTVTERLKGDLGTNGEKIRAQATEFINRLDLMMAELKDRIKTEEESNLDRLREVMESIEASEYDTKEEVEAEIKELVETYQEMYANRSMMAKIEDACVVILYHIEDIIGEGGVPETIPEFLNIMPITLSKREGEASTGDTLKSCLILTELMDTRFNNDAFLETEEESLYTIYSTTKGKIEDPNTCFDTVLDYYAPAIEGEKGKSELDEIRHECSRQVSNAKTYIERLIADPLIADTTKMLCKYLQEKILGIDTGFEKTNNYFSNLLTETTEPGSKEAVEIAKKGLLTMISELRDYAKFMDHMVRQIIDFDIKSIELSHTRGGEQQVKEVMEAITQTMGNQVVYSPNQESKFFETPEMVHGKMLEITGVMQLINRKTAEIIAGETPFAELKYDKDKIPPTSRAFNMRKDEGERVVTVAKRVMLTRILRQETEAGDKTVIESVQKQRAKDMAAHKKRELKAQIAEEKRQRELEEAEAAYERYQAIKETLAEKKEALSRKAQQIKDTIKEKLRRASEDGDNVDPATLEAEERLEVYIPQSATGRLKDYTLKGKKVKGVGKLESIGSCSASKLKERIGKHTKRFLYSRNITSEGLNTTAAAILKGAGYNDKKYMGANIPAVNSLKLVDRINAASNSNELRLLMKSACQDYVAGNGSDEIDLSERFVNAHFAQAKIILMHRVLAQIELTAGQLTHLKEKDRVAFVDRVDAAKENIKLLYRHCIGSPEYTEEIALSIDDEMKAVDREMREYEDKSLDLSALRQRLAEAEGAAHEILYTTVEAVEWLDKEAEARAKDLADKTEDRQSREYQYKSLSLEVSGLIDEVNQEKAAKAKENLVRQGVRSNGKLVENWQLGKYADQVLAYIDENLVTSNADTIEIAIIGFNENLRSNLECVREFLSEKMMGGGDYAYLKNPALYEIAKDGVINSCGHYIFTAASKEYMHRIIDGKLSMKLFAGYKAKVSKMLSALRRDKVLKPYARDIILDDEYLKVVAENDPVQIKRLIDTYKINISESQKIITAAVAELPFEEAQIIEANVKARLGREILKATPQSVENIVAREIDYRKLLNPVAVSGQAEIVEKAKKIVKNPSPEIKEAILSTIEKAKNIASKADEIDHYETDSDYVEYEVIHAVGLATLFSPPGEMYRYALEKLAYYIASENKTSNISSMVMRYLSEYAISHNHEYTEEKLEKAYGGLTATERILASELFEEGKVHKSVNGKRINGVIRDVIQNLSVEVMTLAKALTPTLHDRGIISSDSFDSLTASDVYEVASFVNQRLIPFGEAISTQRSWRNETDVLKALVSRCLDATKPEVELSELMLIGANANARRAEAKMIEGAKKQLLSMGNCWQSKKIHVDIVNRRLNTAAGEKEFRDLNRIGRARTLQQEMARFCEVHSCTAPVSIFEFATLKGNTELSEKELFEKWKTEAIFGDQGWIGGEKKSELKKEKQAFYDGKLHEKVHLRNLRLYAYYGLFEDFSVILKGVGNYINEDSREEFEKKLFEVGRKYALRKKQFLSVCQDYHLSQEEIDRLLPNVSEYFADAPEVVKSNGEEKCQKIFSDYIDRVVDMTSPYTRSSTKTAKTGYMLDDHEKYMAVVTRKDVRMGELARKKGGIFEPLFPYLLGNVDFQRILLGGTDDEYKSYEHTLLEHAREPMEILSEEGSIYNAFIDQYLIRFGAEIIGEKNNPSESWKDTFRDYYKEIVDHNYGTESNPISINQTIIDVSTKASKSASWSKEQDLDNANMVIQVLLSEGATGVFDKKVLEKYRANLKANTKLLQAGLEEIYNTEGYRQYIELGKRHQLMGHTFEDKPEKELKVLYTKSVRMAERTFLVKETPEDYQAHLSTRLEKLLAGAIASLDASVTISRLSKQSHELMDTTVLEVKREGRRLMKAERETLNVYEDRAAEKISPVMAAYMKEKDEMSTKTAHKVVTFLHDMQKDLTGVGYPKALAIEIGAAYVASNKTISLEQMQILEKNLEKLLANLKIKGDIKRQIVLIRLAKYATNPFEEWSNDQITDILGKFDGVEKVAKVYKKFIDAKDILPEDGCLDSYYQSARVAATYIASEGNDEQAYDKLMAIYTLLAKRIKMLKLISEQLEMTELSLGDNQKRALRAGLFDYFAPEICSADVKFSEKKMRSRVQDALKMCATNTQLRDYLMDDSGHTASISSEDTVAQKTDLEFEYVASRTRFEERLRKFARDEEAGDLIKRYFKLGPEERSLFAHMASNAATRDISDISISYILAFGEKREQQELDENIGNEYVNNRTITAPANYQRVERIVFHGKKLDTVVLNLILTGVESKYKKMIEKHLDMKRLSESSAESRAVLKKSAVKSIDSVRGFKEEIRSISSGDSAENQALVERLISLRPYELQMMGMILSDRTAIDSRLTSDEPVNKARYELLRRGLRSNVAHTLGDEKAGGLLMNKALASLCSYRVREDVLILGDLTKEDIIGANRETTIDYDLLRKAFAIMDENHPEGLLHEALRYSYDEVKSRAEIEGLESGDVRIVAYKEAAAKINSPERFKKFVLEKTQGEMQGEISMLDDEEWKLFMLLLANRGAVDISLRDPAKVADEEVKEQIAEEYITHGNVTADDEVYSNALAGIFSKRIDDAMVMADSTMSVKEALDKSEREAVIDLRLISSALRTVRNLSEMHRLTEQNRRDAIL